MGMMSRIKRLHMTLRASVALDGRAVTIFEQVFEYGQYNSPKSHQTFLDKLQSILPSKTSPNRDEAAKAFLNKALAQNGLPEKVVIDGSKSNYAALDALNVQLWLTGYFMLSLVEILDIKYLNNIVEQSHRWVKQKTRQAKL